MIASHYAEPVERRLGREAQLFEEASEGSRLITTLEPGEPFELLDDSLGWAWGYAGAARRVGYVQSECLES